MSKFTQRNYIAIADAIKTSNAAMLMVQWSPSDERLGHRNMWKCGAECQLERTVIALANVFASDNPRFSRATFYRACGMAYLTDEPLSSKCKCGGD